MRTVNDANIDVNEAGKDFNEVLNDGEVDDDGEDDANLTEDENDDGEDDANLSDSAEVGDVCEDYSEHRKAKDEDEEKRSS